MKRCRACAEEFADKFSFCPVDATPLNSLAAALVQSDRTNDAEFYQPDYRLSIQASRERPNEYRVTILASASLPERLAGELMALRYELRRAWLALKRDPIGFARLAVIASATLLKERFGRPLTLASELGALLVVLAAVLLMLQGGSGSKNETAVNDNDQVSVELLNLSPPAPDQMPSGVGVGAGSKGRVGFDQGKGEGSKVESSRARGGGSGGQHDQLAAQKGRIPQPSEIPAPIPKLPSAQQHTLPHAGVYIDPALWKNLPLPAYGDPRSNSTAPSNGPGDGGGMGTAKGQGIGEGSGPGFGPGEDGNIGGGRREIGGGGPRGGSSGNNPDGLDRVFPASLVEQRARVLSKPEPQYTDEARRNQITGTVVLRVVFFRTGNVTNIRAVQSLPFGLTEKAIAAARQIRFVPATKQGHPVSVYMQLEYNFNLY